MNRKFLVFGIIALLFVACRSKEEKANELIKVELHKTLYDFTSYDPIETIVDSAFSSIYEDSVILSYAYTIQACLDLYNEHMEETKEAISSAEIWSDSYSSYGRSKFNDAREKAQTNLDKAKFYIQKATETRPLIKEKIDSFTPSFLGFQAKHKFRCKTKGGHSSLANYLYIMDEKFKKVLSVIDLDDEDELKIRKLIDEAKEYEIQDEK
jgi:hypothetical protein